MMVKSGLGKILSKFLHTGNYFSLLRKIVVLSMSLSMQHTIKILWFRYNGPSQDYQDYQDNHDYDYNYDILADKLSLPTRSVDNAAPSLNAAPKASASDSQDNSAFRTNSMLPGISNSYVLYSSYLQCVIG